MNKLQLMAYALGSIYNNISKMWRGLDSSIAETPVGKRKTGIITLRKKMNTSKYRPLER